MSALGKMLQCREGFGLCKVLFKLTSLSWLEAIHHFLIQWWQGFIRSLNDFERQHDLSDWQINQIYQSGTDHACAFHSTWLAPWHGGPGMRCTVQACVGHILRPLSSTRPQARKGKLVVFMLPPSFSTGSRNNFQKMLKSHTNIQ